MKTLEKVHIKLMIPKAGVLIILFFICFFTQAENHKRIIDLEGRWKFTIGDDPTWAEPDYDDREWDNVTVPRSWENDGFTDYNGFAWYRKEFTLNNFLDDETPFLVLGYIDDVDEVYLNGKMIGGTGVMPPLVSTAFRVLRKYPLPTELLNQNGKNVIAVRVFDEYLDGGIYSGPVGIYYDTDNELLSLNLAGYWDFETTFEADNTAKNYYNQNEGKIYVPGYWESLGYAKYDGKAVYSTNFYLPASFNDEDIMIVLGFIDDIDKVYINDQRIGSVESLVSNKDEVKHFDVIFRGYAIPPGLLVKGGFNKLQVKVYDTGGLGGIYEGPVGLISSDNFKILKKIQRDKSYNIWESFFKDLFEWD